MFTPEGYFNITPKIKSLSFPKRGYFEVDLEDRKYKPLHHYAHNLHPHLHPRHTSRPVPFS